MFFKFLGALPALFSLLAIYFLKELDYLFYSFHSLDFAGYILELLTFSVLCSSYKFIVVSRGLIGFDYLIGSLVLRRHVLPSGGT